MASPPLLRSCWRLLGSASTRSSTSYAQKNDGQSFKVFTIPGRKIRADTRSDRKRRKFNASAPRYLKMDPGQDWSIAWPTASTFKWSAVPLPIRQGYIENSSENAGIIPGKYANAELMKIPNFLHLSPAHIKKQCTAIKQFCTEWPAGLDEDRYADHFPIEVTTTDYCYSGPSLRDPRARTVRVKVDVHSLNLDEKSEEKFRRLAGEKYDFKTKTLTLTVDRCPLKKQNYDYAVYLLTALYHESIKVEPWESEKTVNDMLSYSWESSQSKASCLSLLQAMPAMANMSEAEFMNMEEVARYAKAVENLRNQTESEANLNSYKESVLKLLNLKGTLS